MKRYPLILLFPIVLSAIPALLPAQEGTEGLVLLTRFDVDLQDDTKFREYMRQRVQAARQAGLPAEHGWTTLRTDNTWLVLQRVPSLTALDGSDVLIGQVRGTPGEATLRGAQATLMDVDYTQESRLLAGPSTWRYKPANAAPRNYAFVQEFRVKPGSQDAFDARRADFVTFLREIGLPYHYESFRPRIGKEVVVGIVWPDDLVRYYRDFSPAVFTQRYPERFPPLSQRLREHIKDMDTTLYSVMHEFSYSSR